MILCEGDALKDTLDDVAYTCVLVSYHPHSPQFQFSLSAVTLQYLSQWVKQSKLYTVCTVLLKFSGFVSVSLF